MAGKENMLFGVVTLLDALGVIDHHYLEPRILSGRWNNVVS
jgi:hypothetical protein